MESRSQTDQKPQSSPHFQAISDEAFHRFSDIFGCKWTLAILEALERDISRPSELQRALPGLTAKILNQRIQKLMRYELIERREFAEIPPRVEYSLTPRGDDIRSLIGEIRQFAKGWDAAS